MTVAFCDNSMVETAIAVSKKLEAEVTA